MNYSELKWNFPNKIWCGSSHTDFDVNPLRVQTRGDGPDDLVQSP